MDNAVKGENEGAGKEETEASGEQALIVSKEQEENATEEEGDGAQDPEGNTAKMLDRRAGEWKNEADEERAGGNPRRTSPMREQRGSKKQNPAISQERRILSQVRARLQGSAPSIIRRAKRRPGEEEK
ncbi:hypothetical protein NDU88_002178 [Pleurodeles waltl]|uniref:Uncharacterized protein n=1 Tax=Pleurodeles waltl TaxID=8319 RepID=A0AAV7WQW8_PLEWA|nr:hypothetical protein NDU88_002178 [Pleurodeles waltl]